MRISDWSSDVCSSDLADAEHVGVDVGDRDARAETLHAKGAVAGAARHVEDRLAFARLDAAHEAVFRQPVHPARHRVVHNVIFARDADANFAENPGLSALGGLSYAEAAVSGRRNVSRFLEWSKDEKRGRQG